MPELETESSIQMSTGSFVFPEVGRRGGNRSQGSQREKNVPLIATESSFVLLVFPTGYEGRKEKRTAPEDIRVFK